MKILLSKKNLKKALSQDSETPSFRVGIICAKFNETLTQSLLNQTEKILQKSGITNTRTIRVPGSYEIPVVAARMARSKEYHVLIALGVILQGKTLHAEHIGMSITLALQQLAVETETPIIHQILTPSNLRDAKSRVQLRGTEAALAAVEMCRVMRH